MDPILYSLDMGVPLPDLAAEAPPAPMEDIEPQREAA